MKIKNPFIKTLALSASGTSIFLFATLFVATIFLMQAQAGETSCKPTPSSEAIYDQLFPTYIESCAGTQEKPKNMGFGGSVGHSFFYIRGACRDTSAKIPTLTTNCDSANPDQQGVGISVDQVYDNVNWVAIDNRDLFFRGSLNECSPLSQEVSQETINNALKKHIFQNIKINQTFKTEFEKQDPKLSKLTDEQWLATEGIGTNYAINFHRNIICARIPMPLSRIQKTVDYLNSLNKKTSQDGAHYVWSRLHNNCSHVVHNALAAAGVFNFEKTDVNFIRQLANLAIPGWEIVQDEKYATDRIFDVVSLYKNKREHANIISGWLPTQAGGTIDYIPIHDYKNDIAYTDSDIFLVDIPKIGYHTFNFNRYMTKPFFRDLRTNLTEYLKIYSNAIRNSNEVSGFLFPSGAGQIPEDFDDGFRKPYYIAYLQKQLKDTQARLELLDQLQKQQQQ